MVALAVRLPDPVDFAKGLVSGAVNAPVSALADAIASAVQTMLTTLGTAWIKIDTPQLATVDGHPSEAVGFLQGQLTYVVGVCAIFALIVGGARMAWEQRAEPARDVLRGLFTLAVVSGCGLAVIGLAVSASDQLAEHIIDASTNGNGMGKSLMALFDPSGVQTPFLIVFLGGIALLVTVVQIGFIVFRAGALVVLAGLMPLAASMTAMPTGREHFRKYVGWIVALVAYKPCAALAYAAAFQLLSADTSNADGLLAILVGLALMTMAVVALPALLRFMVPAVGAIGVTGGGHGGAMMAAMAMPIGARVIPAGGGVTGGAHAPRPAAGPSGATTTPGPGGPSGPAGGQGALGGPGAGATPQNGSGAAPAAQGTP